jgi:hypothetical protein
MHHEPRGLIRNAEHAVNLMGRNAALAGHVQKAGKPPFRQRHLGALENGSDCDCEKARTGSANERSFAELRARCCSENNGHKIANL